MRAIEGGATTLMYACQQCREAQVLELIRKQPQSVRERDRTAKTPLHYCAENADTSCAEALLRAAPELVDAQDDNGYCPLHLAVIAGNKALVKLLIARGADVNRRDDEGHSAVHWAIVSSEREALEMIIRAGADPSTPDVRGGYPLHYAVQMCGSICGCDYSRSFEDAIRVVGTLLNFGVDVNVKDKDSRQPILWAASAGSADAVIHLVSAGACVEAADKDGLTALHCAASRGHTTTLETLISLCGAHVDVIDANGCSALFYSVTLGHADATELLLRLGAEPNRQDRKGRTPAHCGAAKGQLETIRILQKHGGDLWLRNVKGDIPLHEAVASGRKDLVLWLLSQNPDAINLANNDGRCPLHIASMYNNTEMVKVLLDSKALVNPVMRTSKGVLMTPLNVALCRGHRSCGKYLQLHGGVPFSKVARLEPASGLAVRVSPCDEMPDSGEANEDSCSHSKVLKSKRGSEELEKIEFGEKKKVYRRRRKKKNDGNPLAMDSESEGDGSDVKMKKSPNRRIKKGGGKNGQEGRTREKKLQRDARGVRTEANSNREGHAVAEDGAAPEVATEGETLLSTKSFSETKNVSHLSPEDFPAQMQTIDQLDAVITEPDVEGQRAEDGAECSTGERNGATELNAQAVRTQDDEKIEVKEKIEKQIASLQESSTQSLKTEQVQAAVSKKCIEDNSPRKGVNDSRPKSSDGGEEKERTSNSELKADQQMKATEDGDVIPKTNLETVTDSVVPEDKADRILKEVVEHEGPSREGVVTAESENSMTLFSGPRIIAKEEGEQKKEEEIERAEGVGREEQAEETDGLKYDKEIKSESEVEKKEENKKRGEIEKVTIEKEILGEGNNEKEIPFKAAQSEEERKFREIENNENLYSATAFAVSENPTGNPTGNPTRNTEEETNVSDEIQSYNGNTERPQRGANPPVLAPAEERHSRISFERGFKVDGESIVGVVEENTKNRLALEFPDSKTSNEQVKVERKAEEEEEKRENERKEKEETSPYEANVGEEKVSAEEEENASQRKESSETEAKDQETAKGARVKRLCRRQKDLKADISNASVTQLVQNTLRKYHMERGIFYQLLELKRYQIRSGRANEQVLVKRLADEYGRERAFLGMKPYSGLYRFRDFEKFLYDQLKALNARRGLLVPEGRSHDDIDALSAFLKKSRYKIINEVPRPEMTCTCITQRCHHSACAYTSVPCAAYMTDLRRLKRPKPRREGFFPRIDQPPPPNADADEVVGRPATLELSQGTERHVITLPQSSPDRGRRYYVTFTIKGAPAPKSCLGEAPPTALFEHRHARSV